MAAGDNVVWIANLDQHDPQWVCGLISPDPLMACAMGDANNTCRNRKEVISIDEDASTCQMYGRKLARVVVK